MPGGITKYYPYTLTAEDDVALIIGVQRGQTGSGTHTVYWSTKNKWTNLPWELTLQLDPSAEIIQLPPATSVLMLLAVEYPLDGDGDPVNDALGFEVYLLPAALEVADIAATMGIEIETPAIEPLDLTTECMCVGGTKVCELEVGEVPDCETDCSPHEARGK